jgi:hypothetical protein
MYLVQAKNITQNLLFDIKKYNEKPVLYSVIDITIFQQIKVEIVLENGKKEKFWTPVTINVHKDTFELTLKIVD